MRPNKDRRTEIILYGLLLIPLLFAAAALAQATEQAQGLAEITVVLSSMRDDECLLLMRSEDPVIDKKYNLLHHPNVKYTPDAGGEPYVMPPDYMGDAVTITMDAVAAATAPEITEEMYEQLDYLEKHPEENYYENEENFSQYDQGD